MSEQERERRREVRVRMIEAILSAGPVASFDRLLEDADILTDAIIRREARDYQETTRRSW